MSVFEKLLPHRSSRPVQSVFRFVLLPVVLSSTTAFAFSVDDISNLQNATGQVKSLAELIRTQVEPFCADSTESGADPFTKDSVRKSLLVALNGIQDTGVESGSFQYMMVQGLAWHLLYRLGEDNSYRKADSLISRAVRRYPSCPDGAWLKGVNQISSTHILDGFRILDSLSTDAGFERQRFLSDYASLSAKCFLPQGIRGAETVFTVKPQQSLRTPVFLAESETAPAQTGWSVHSPVGTPGALPIFRFTAEFSLMRQFTLVFPSLHNRTNNRFTMNLPPAIANSVPAPLIEDPFRPAYAPLFSITVAPASCSEPLMQFMRTLTADRYDMITQRHELEKLGAISLRCHTRSAFSDIAGYDHAIIAFDRTVREDALCINSSCAEYNHGKTIRIRYVITMESMSAVDDKSELILQNVLKNFEAFN